MSYLNDRVFDQGIQVLTNEVNRIDLCSALPATYAEATSTLSLGNRLAPSMSAPADRSPSGRQVTISGFSDGLCTGDGAAAYWALTDTTNSRLLAAAALAAPTSVTIGGIFGIDDFAIGFPGELTATEPGPDPEPEEPEYHLFCVAGQSNAEGRGDSALSPTVETGAAYEFTGGVLVQLQDPVGGANTGSAWPAFAQTYFDLTGNFPVIVETARGNSAQDSAAEFGGNGNWDASGSLRGAAVTAINAALSYLSSEGLPHSFKGLLWSQGERDAGAIDSSTITQADYQAAFEAMLTFFRAEYGATMPLYIIQTGRYNSGDTGGFQDVREAQETVADAQADTHIAYSGAVNFPDQGRMSDEVHYNQAALNEIGTMVANFIAPRAPTGILLSKTTIREDAPVGEPVATLSATDPNPGDTHTFSIVADPDAKFSIDGNALELAATASFPGSHDVTIRATDSGGLTFDQEFTITVLQVATAAILMDGDAQSGTDRLLLDGDAQSGTDVILYREIIE